MNTFQLYTNNVTHILFTMYLSITLCIHKFCNLLKYKKSNLLIILWLYNFSYKIPCQQAKNEKSSVTVLNDACLIKISVIAGSYVPNGLTDCTWNVLYI